jgi:hypothetical protein
VHPDVVAVLDLKASIRRSQALHFHKICHYTIFSYCACTLIFINDGLAELYCLLQEQAKDSRISSLDPPSLTFRGFFEANCVQKDGTGEAVVLLLASPSPVIE